MSNRSYYCQSDIEGNRKCENQCKHCKEYYKPLEDQADRQYKILKKEQNKIDSDFLSGIQSGFEFIKDKDHDIGDLGNEIGYAFGKIMMEIKSKEERDQFKINFLHGINHGISIQDGTH